MNSNVFVLSRDIDIDRRLKFTEQASKINLRFNFFDAYTPNAISCGLDFSEKTELTNGERCCAYSHVKIMEKIIHNKLDHAVIFEDDAIFDERIVKLMPYIYEMHKTYDVIIIGYSKVEKEIMDKIQLFRPLVKQKKYSSFGVGIPYKQWKCGTVCYSISKKGAEKLYNINYNALHTADDWFFFEQNGLKVGHLMPILVIEDSVALPSSLEIERKTNISRPIYQRYIAGLLRHFFLIKKIF